MSLSNPLPPEKSEPDLRQDIQTSEKSVPNPVHTFARWGTYDIIVKRGKETNFNVTYIKGKLTITKAPLKITAKDYTIKQGEALPAFEAIAAEAQNYEISYVKGKLTVEKPDDIIPGDANGDGMVNAADITQIANTIGN